MTMLKMFCSSMGKYKDFYYPFDDVVIDHNISKADGFLFDDKKKIKKITILNKQAYGFHIANSSEISFVSLHFQGDTKPYMYEYSIITKYHLLGVLYHTPKYQFGQFNKRYLRRYERVIEQKVKRILKRDK